MLFALGFVSLFITGGLTGPILAQPILDEYLHNTFFVVAHFHLIMAMAGVFGLICATYYWFPLLFNRQLSEPLGKWHFWLTLFFSYSAFLPMHLAGLAGEPRHYAQLTGLTSAAAALLQSTLPLQRHITVSAIALGVTQVLFLFNLVRTLLREPNTSQNPWNATTLEWAPDAMLEHANPLIVTRDPCLYSHDGEEFFPQWESDSVAAASDPE
jgi:cytochrome c oxidase subunit 1